MAKDTIPEAKPDLDPDGYDRLIDFMESPRYQMLQQHITRDTVEHLMVRMGFRMHGPDAYNELQEQMAFLRRLHAMEPSLEERMDKLEARFDNSEKRQADRFDSIMKALDEKHTENKKVQDASALERSEIKKDIESTKRTTLIQMLMIAGAIIGTLVIRYVLP